MRGVVERTGPALVLAAVLLGYFSQGLGDPAPADVPSDEFSAARAAEAVAPVVAEPRPAGTEANTRARELLAEKLADEGFTVAEPEAVGVLVGEGPYAGRARVGLTRNLLATRPGTDPTGTVVLATHVDSVAGTPGAADPGVGLAVILESVSALGDDVLRNDLVVLLVDGEEDGMLGADGLLRSGRLDHLAEPVVVLNHEARGVSGRPLVVRTAGPVGEALSAMPEPQAESVVDAMFAVVPNDSDFTEYRAAGWWGMDLAMIGGSWAYHSPQDDLDHLDRSTLQHYGDLSLAVARSLAGADLAALEDRTAERPVMTTAPWGIVALPPLLVTLLGLAAPLALIGAAAVRRDVRWRGVLVGAGGFLAALVLGVAVSVLAWLGIAAAIDGRLSAMLSEPVHCGPFIAAEVCVAVAVAGLLGWWLRRRRRATDLAVGAGLAASVVVAVVAVVSPALSVWLVVPVVVAAVGGLTTSTVVRLVALSPMAWMCGTKLALLSQFGVASARGLVAALVVVGLAVAAPLVARERETEARRPWLPATVAAALAVVLIGAGVAANLRSAEPTQIEVTARVDADRGRIEWSATGGDEWSRSLDGLTDASDLPGPEVDVTRQGDRVTLRISSPRGAPFVKLTLPDDSLREVSVDGTDVTDGELSHVELYGVEPGQTVTVEAVVDGPVDLTVVDVTYDLTEARGPAVPPEGLSLVWPMLEVRRELTL
ncbi:MAG: M28 family peptidase [Aeromicrobium sp.]|uniref:M28 family peptidase n=1 Tax=Aeromicrobium sp. TaxID=1871063 RepID=UPI0039E51DD6